MCPTQRMISEIDCRNPLDGVKKLISSTFLPKGWVDFRSFRMRALKSKGICLDNNELRDDAITLLDPKKKELNDGKMGD
jgi:hypothetical protein